MKKKAVLLTYCMLLAFTGCGRGPIEVEERTVLLADPAFLKEYKRECLAQRGKFCAKEVGTKYVSGNLYSDMIYNTEYLITCTKPKNTKCKPECVIVK